MADKTRPGSDSARSKRRTLSVKTKRKQPFVLESFLSHADGGRTKAKYRKNEIIFRRGDPADAVFYILGGECKVTVVSEKGKEAVVAVHEKRDFFGEGCLNGHRRRPAFGARLLHYPKVEDGMLVIQSRARPSLVSNFSFCFCQRASSALYR